LQRRTHDTFKTPTQLARRLKFSAGGITLPGGQKKNHLKKETPRRRRKKIFYPPHLQPQHSKNMPFLRKAFDFFSSRLSNSRFGLLYGLAFCFLAISFLSRLALCMQAGFAGEEAAWKWHSLLGAFLMGAGYDFLTLPFLLAPWVVFLALLPNRVALWRASRFFVGLGVGVFLFVLLFSAVAEWFFWDEFSSRFNFIAVDYLFYTHEVIGNIWESYSTGKILLLVAFVALALSWPLTKRSWSGLAKALSWKQRLVGILTAVLLPFILFHAFSSTGKNRFSTDTLNELAGNGFYEFASAAHNNALDYVRLYASLPEDEAYALVREKQSLTVEEWHSENLEDRRYAVHSPGKEKHLNVILISVESLGTNFLGAWGDERGLSPRIDALAKESLLLAEVYATGNRTVRGLEALALAIPPTPGQSIVKRPNNAHMFTLGHVFRSKGYEAIFLYGGYSYFDNMHAFFHDNNHRVVDSQAIPKENIHYENIWGVADEDLFQHALVEIDALLKNAQGPKPFFMHIMTTSNHRPYTYPEGRIDIPSGTGRNGAVKYSDWAIGHFIDEAKKTDWFDNTLFVITADHGANARGVGELPIAQYRIPLLFYAPAHIQPQRVERLMSQMDIPPTLLGLLHFSYESKFFGQDIFRLPEGEERAFVANYQSLGYLRDGRLVMLYPMRKTRVGPHPNAGPTNEAAALDEAALLREAIAWYQSAAMSFSRGTYGASEK
jgi:phosphoglycerol transferase MdoB-like AlkP superfamily enzyme